MKGAQAGFTLLEVVVVLAVLGFLSLLLAQGLRLGLRTVAVREASQNLGGNLEPVDRTLRDVFAEADPGIYPEPASLRGTAHAVSLTTALPLRFGGPLQPADVVVAAENGLLLLRWAPHRHVRQSAPPPARTEVLIDGVAGIDLDYWRGDGWLPDWTGEKLPALVRLRIRFDPRSGRHWPPMVVAPRREPVEE